MATFPYYILDHGFSAVFSQRPFSCNSPSPLSDRPLSLCGPSYVTLCLCTHGAQLPNRKHTCLRPMIQDPNLLSNPSSTYQSRPAVVEGHNLLTRQLGGEGGGGSSIWPQLAPSQCVCLSIIPSIGESIDVLGMHVHLLRSGNKCAPSSLIGDEKLKGTGL